MLSATDTSFAAIAVAGPNRFERSLSRWISRFRFISQQKQSLRTIAQGGFHLMQGIRSPAEQTVLRMKKEKKALSVLSVGTAGDGAQSLSYSKLYHPGAEGAWIEAKNSSGAV